jgi:hypothetical protein
MSTSSNASFVSYRGEDRVELDEALNSLYGDIQTHLNYSQCSIRQLAACPEQDADFIEAVKIYFELTDYVECLLGLFKELKGVSKQCLGKCPKEFKDEYKKMCDDRKDEKLAQKMNDINMIKE